MQDFFNLFNLPVQFDLDMAVLDDAYRHVQRLVHPDRFVTASEAEKRAAVQYASLVNDAYQTLRDPLKRAVHLCGLNGVSVEGESRQQMDPLFLMAQMDWRERLETARAAGDRAGLQALAEEQMEQHEMQLQTAKEHLDAHRFKDAAVEVNKLMFLERFGKEVHQAMDGFLVKD